MSVRRLVRGYAGLSLGFYSPTKGTEFTEAISLCFFPQINTDGHGLALCFTPVAGASFEMHDGRNEDSVLLHSIDDSVRKPWNEKTPKIRANERVYKILCK